MNFIKTPDWVYRALSEGFVSADQFDLLVFAYYRAEPLTVNGHRVGTVVRAYSAERLCRFRGLDANDENLRRYQRAESDLRNRGIVRDTWQRGRKKPYDLYLPAYDPFGQEKTDETDDFSLCNRRVGDSVGDSVGDETAATAVPPGSYESSEGGLVGDSVGDSVAVLSINTPVGKEKDPLPPEGVLPLPAPRGDCAQTPQGCAQSALASSESSQEDQTKSLSSRQANDLKNLAEDFATAWAEYHRGFSCDSNDVKQLLRCCSPLEVLTAYRRLVTDLETGARKDLTNARQAAFFSRSAKSAVKSWRREGKLFIFLLGCQDAELGAFFDLDEKWRELFHKPPLMAYCEHFDGDLRYYHPRLHNFLTSWKKELDVEEKRIAAARRAEEDRIATAEKQKREAEHRLQEEQRQEAERIRQQEQQKAHREDVAKRLCVELEKGPWVFDGDGGWTACGVTVRLDERGDTAAVIDSKGKSTQYSTNNLAYLAYRATCAD